MTIRTLSKATIASLPAIEGQWWDDKLPGFGYRQRKPKADGSVYASYVVHYRFGGEQKKFTLGDARRINADQARKAALKLFGEIVSGIDPQAVKQSERIEAAKLTFSEAVAQYLEHKRTEVRESSLQNMRTYLTGAAYFPALHNKAIDAVTNAEVAARVDRIGREIGGPTAGQARAILSSFYSWAWKRGLCPTNIVLATEAPKADSSRKRTLTDDELKRVWDACGADDYGRIIKLLILTGCRREEIGGLRWSEINAGAITIPGERTKNHEPHTLPLSDMAMKIIDGIKRREGCDFLFGPKRGFVNWGNAKAALDKRLGTMESWTVHDLRRTLSTGMNEHGMADPHVVESILNHVGGHKAGDAGVYNRATYKAQIANALARWADHVRAVVTGEPAKVVTLKRSA